MAVLQNAHSPALQAHGTCMLAVTFLALGNGAPDISASIAAVRAGQYKMALGSLLGEHARFESLPQNTHSLGLELRVKQLNLVAASNAMHAVVQQRLLSLLHLALLRHVISCC